MQDRSSVSIPFANRRAAGAALAHALRNSGAGDNAVVLGLPRGGVPVAYEVASSLHAPLDVFVVRKLGFPGQPELAMGAIASGGVRVLNEDVLGWHRPSDAAIEAITHAERDARPLIPIEGRTVILVDDGLATGSTMRAAVLAVRQMHPARIIVAVPVGARQTCAALREIADEIVCAYTPDRFSAVGLWYEDFSQTTDEEVRRLLDLSAKNAM